MMQTIMTSSVLALCCCFLCWIGLGESLDHVMIDVYKRQALPDRCFGRHDCGVRGGVFWKPAGGASDTVLETEDEKTRGQKK